MDLVAHLCNKTCHHFSHTVSFHDLKISSYIVYFDRTSTCTPSQSPSRSIPRSLFALSLYQSHPSLVCPCPIHQHNVSTEPHCARHLPSSRSATHHPVHITASYGPRSGMECEFPSCSPALQLGHKNCAMDRFLFAISFRTSKRSSDGAPSPTISTVGARI